MGKRLSWRGYADILCMTSKEAMSAAEISAEAGASVPSTRLLLRRMRDLKLLHISGWTDAGQHVVPTPKYSEGEGVDVIAPLTFRGQPSKHQAATLIRLSQRCNLNVFAVLVRALKAAPATRAALAGLTGCDQDSIGRLITHMREIGLVHVADWQRGVCGNPKECLAWGGLADVPRPKPKNADLPRKAEAQRRRKRWAADGLVLTPQTLITICPPKPAPRRTSTFSM